MIYIGIDPGKKGAIAIIDGDDVAAVPWDDDGFVRLMRMTKHECGMDGEGIIVAVEKVGAVHGNGIVSTFSFGKNAGYIEGVLAALGIPYQLVPPTMWKKEFSLIGKDKKASIDTCKRLFPELNLRRTDKCRTDSDGLAESTLLAEYARRKF